MADILIRGMEKPGSCRECDFCEVQDINFETLYFCNRNDRFLDDEEACNIPNDCPIIELPEHGDLIDADSLADDLLYDVELAERALDDTSLVGKEREYAQSEKDIKQNCAYYVSHAPVVIPSNKEDAE